MSTTSRRPLTAGERSAIHLSGELEQLLRTLHPLSQSDQEAVADAIAYIRLARRSLRDLGLPDDDDGDVTLPPLNIDGEDEICALWDRRAVPPSLLDTRVPQPGRERDYGVPDCIIEAADLLYRHRHVVPEEDVELIDLAILRLYRPWYQQ